MTGGAVQEEVSDLQWFWCLDPGADNLFCTNSDYWSKNQTFNAKDRKSYKSLLQKTANLKKNHRT